VSGLVASELGAALVSDVCCAESTPGIVKSLEAVGADEESELVSKGAVLVGAVSVPASWAKAIAVGETMKLIERTTARGFRSAIPFRCQRRELRRI
jgi:hypothetical protein